MLRSGGGVGKRGWGLPEVDGKTDACCQLERGDGVEVGAEGLLAGLVPEQRAARIGACGAAKEGKVEQRRLGNAPRPLLGPRLIDPESRKGEEVHRDDGGGDIGGVSGERDEIHARAIEREGFRKG